jgi:prefoldin subunit 5
MFEAGRIIRAGHEDIVSQLAPDLAAETSINAVERILKTRLERLDSDLADRIEKLDELFDAVE